MTLRSRLALAAALCSIAATAARADGFATTNIQFLGGFSFDDTKYGYDTSSGTMGTITINHFSTWEYGDNFAFVDLYTGNFKDNTGSQPGAKLYAEWHPRLFINKLAGTTGDTLGIFRNWGLAGEVNQGSGFYAYLIGLGVDFALPAPYGLGLNVYYRYDRFDKSEWQVSPFWNVPFSIGPVPFLFTGFIDVCGTTDAAGSQGIDFLAQPQLLVDVLGAFGGKANRLWVGTEWYVHAYPSGVYGPSHTVSAPQAMVQWTWH